MKNLLVVRIIAALLLLALAGCSQTEMLQKFASPAEQSVARNYIDSLRHKRLVEIEKAADPSIASPTLHDTLVRMADLFPAGEPTSVNLVGAHRIDGPESLTINLTFEYGFSGKWFLTNVATKAQGGKTTIVGVSVTPQPGSLEEQTKFTLGGKTPLQYAVFMLVVSLPLVTLFALVVCFRTKLMGRKWPWILFILFGFGKLIVNWTTGQWAFVPLAVQMFSASAYAPLYGQWTLGVSLPLGAVLFLLLRQRLRAPFGNI